MSDAEGALVGRVGMRFTERFGATLQLTHVIDEKNERSLQLVGPEVVVFASPRWSFDAGAGVAHFVEESQNRASDICTLIGCLPETVRERTERSGLFGTVGATSLLTTRSKRGRHRRALALSISMTGYSLPGDGLHALGRVALGYSF